MRKTKEKGITLIALVVTIVVLLILAGITIQLVFNNEGILNQAQNASKQYKIAQAREKLEITLNNAQIDKAINKKYNENDYLDDFILKNTANTKIVGEIVIVDEYAFEIDRSIPKIGKYIGEESELIFPKVTTNVKIAQDLKSATITINAKEEKNGISKIEIWQSGEMLEEYSYNSEKEEITKEYIAKQNGEYIVKVYSNLSIKKITDVTGILSSVIFEPNGNKEWKKSHSSKVTTQETEEMIVNAKYYWSDSVVEPTDDKFTNIFHDGDTITENSNALTGTYYLWTMLETSTGTKVKWRSEEFSFDNEEPTISLEAQPVSETSFTLTATASDYKSGIARYEFYVDHIKVDTQTTTEGTATYTWVGTEMTENKECYVIVYDKLDNSNRENKSARTFLHTWNIWDAIKTGERLEIVLEDEVTEWVVSTHSSGTWSTYKSDYKPSAVSFEVAPLPPPQTEEYCKENPNDAGWIWSITKFDDYGRYHGKLLGYAYTYEFDHESDGNTVWWTYWNVRGRKLKEAKTEPIYEKRT